MTKLELENEMPSFQSHLLKKDVDLLNTNSLLVLDN